MKNVWLKSILLGVVILGLVSVDAVFAGGGHGAKGGPTIEICNRTNVPDATLATRIAVMVDAQAWIDAGADEDLFLNRRYGGKVVAPTACHKAKVKAGTIVIVVAELQQDPLTGEWFWVDVVVDNVTVGKNGTLSYNVVFNAQGDIELVLQ